MTLESHCGTTALVGTVVDQSQLFGLLERIRSFGLELAVDDPAADPFRFLDEQHEKWPGHWAAPPARWDELPEECLTGRETLETAQRAISSLPTVQRQVIVLRDIEGWEAEDVCALL